MSNQSQKNYEKSLHEAFPFAHFTILSYGGNQSSPMTIRCDDCGRIRVLQRPDGLLRKQSFCPLCKSQYYQKFKKLCEDNQVELLSYDTVKTNAHLRCNKCGKDFVKQPTNAVQKNSLNCPYCSSKSPAHKYVDFQQRINDVFGNNEYKILEKDFVGADKIHIQHKCGFIYTTRVYDFLKSNGCPRCSGKRSKGVMKIIDYLMAHNIPYEMEYSIPGNQRFDFWVKDSTAIEYQGEQHFYPTYGIENFKKTQERDLKKKKYCEENNIPIIYITYKQLNEIDEILSETL